MKLTEVSIVILIFTIAMILLLLTSCASNPYPADGTILIPIPEWAEGKVIPLSRAD